MAVVSKEQLAFAKQNGVVVTFFGDGYGNNVLARYETPEGVEHGFIVLLGVKRRPDGKPHTVESAIAEALQELIDSAAVREQQAGADSD